MAAPPKCPECGAKLDPEATVCPECPMSFPEDYGRSDVNHPLRDAGRWSSFLAPAAFLIMIGVGVWSLAAGLLRIGQENSVIESSPALHGGQPARPAPAAPAKPELAPIPAPQPEPEPEPALAPIETPKRRKAVKEWRLRGSVYDLVTLQPVRAVTLVFVDSESDRRIQTRTDSEGRYKTLVPPNGRGYQVMISRQGYAPSYMASPEIARMSQGERIELAQDLAASLHAPSSVSAPDGEPFITDFYLAPRK